MTPERYYELTEEIKQAIAGKLSKFHIEHGETEVSVELNKKGQPEVTSEGQKWIITLQPR